ncbi:MAG: DUF898 family protein [Pseudomonadota bacterium]
MLTKPPLKYEPISDLFGDVVQDKPSEFYLSDEEQAEERRLALEAARRAEAAQETATEASAQTEAELQPDAPEPSAQIDGRTAPGPAPHPSAPDAPPRGGRRRFSQRLSVPPPKGPPPPARGGSSWDGPSGDVAVQYQDDHGLLSSVVITHGLLSVLSLGIWRFWMKTQTRVVLWSHTKIGEEPLEWTGKGRELLIGFLIAAVFLACTLAVANLAIAFLGIGTAENFQTMAAAQAAVVAGVALLPLRQYALFRARRYRLSRTRWRGIRFGMDGSGLTIVGLWALWTPVVVLTAGLAFPLWRWAREKHMARRMRWGQERFTLSGHAFTLMPAFLPLYTALALAGGAAISPGVRKAMGPFDPLAVAEAGPFAIIGMALISVSLLWVMWMSYRAAEIRAVLGGLSLRGARLRSKLTAMHLIEAYFLVMRKNLWPGIGVYIFIAIITAIPLVSAVGAEINTFGAGGLLGSERLERELFEGFTTWRAQGLILMAMLLNYVLYAVFQLWLWVGVYAKRVHENICNTLTVEGVEHLEELRQSARDQGVEAEGFADALDIGAAA